MIDSIRQYLDRNVQRINVTIAGNILRPPLDVIQSVTLKIDRRSRGGYIRKRTSQIQGLPRTVIRYTIMRYRILNSSTINTGSLTIGQRDPALYITRIYRIRRNSRLVGQGYCVDLHLKSFGLNITIASYILGSPLHEVVLTLTEIQKQLHGQLLTVTTKIGRLPG